ncbi:Electron transport complex subunit RsxD [Labrenzia sp. THAF82]|uniref:RnfABCDGE type electron transport complex subunit D n=1 Tax=Labrenzia sp. THAF82 TaxID=2587861 RepID=UPI001267931E|nr:RnfABCDGE type electron transport complex subunit D [Labrenzia sp. THAF82]QFT32210.1 Electron transport complex subunit RsxD [Labrenzia sp. THAF82]
MTLKAHASPLPAPAPVSWNDKRLAGLSRFAVAITVLNILGHFWLGFEQSWATPFVALGAAYGTELFLEWLSARDEKRRPAFVGERLAPVKFLLSAHVTALAVAMLLMPHEQLWVIAFAASLAIASKRLFRVRIGKANRHFLNPSNFGITAVLLLFPAVGIAPPYQFSEGTYGALDVLLPLIIICTGTLLNTKLTGRMPLIAAWVAGFAVQAVLRGLFTDAPILAGLAPMTGFAFILFTFYMVTDPATTPNNTHNQVIFGLAVAALYAVLLQFHIVFGMFYALTLVTMSRGLWFGVICPLIKARRQPDESLEPAE